MHHNFIDRYSDLDSPVHRLSAVVKMATAALILVCALLIPTGKFVEFILYWALLLIALFLSRIPVGYVAAKFAVILPVIFVTSLFAPFFKPGEVIWQAHYIVQLVITREGVLLCLNILLKGSICIFSMIVLFATTPFNDMVATLRSWKVPAIFTMLLSFMYRYIFVFIDQAERVMTAERSRGFGLKGWRRWETAGHIVAAIFTSAFIRSERVFEAMCARGFDGTIRVMNRITFSRSDALALAVIAATIILFKIIGVLLHV